MQIIQLFCHIPDSPKDDDHVFKDGRGVPASFVREFSSCGDMQPLLVCDIKWPEIVELLRTIIFSSKNVHVAFVYNGWMTTSWFWLLLTWWYNNVLPGVSREVVNWYFISPCSLLETSEYYHLRRFTVKDCSMLISDFHLVTSSLDDGPPECPHT